MSVINRPLLIVANWKMNLTVGQGSLLIRRLEQHLSPRHGVEVVVAPSYVSLQPLSMQIDRRKLRLAAQDAYPVDEGSFTGAVSFTQLHDLVHYVIVGHSERRLYFHEDLPLVRDKMAAAVRNHVIPILCIGENKQERMNGETKQVLHDQLVTALADLTSEDAAKVVVAYEPVWAIGADQPASAESISEAASWIRFQIKELYGEKTATDLRLLYGGSSDAHNAASLLDVEGIDGLLIGRASLNYSSFSKMIKAAEDHYLASGKHHG